MFLKLVMEPLPAEAEALAALEAARAVCDASGVPPLIAWRDHVVLQHWYATAHPDGMVSVDEEHASNVWESALGAARYALRLRADVFMDIEVVTFAGMPGLTGQHGPTRYLWRRHWESQLKEWAANTLTLVRRN